ncbi:hypothetical protein [Pseudomonas orientalis]|uniref:hypothetical protein n=1 Tax=Pseudomonas orientalis TaxID=76758 RepID=UPI003B967C0F
MFVDEYQDCTLPQHQIIAWLATALPNCVLCDPLQAILDSMSPWLTGRRMYLATFPLLGTFLLLGAGVTSRLNRWASGSCRYVHPYKLDKRSTFA